MKCKKILTALLAAACTMSGCHGDLDIMQDNKLSASNMWIDESNANILLWPITQESIIKNSKLKQTEGWY